MNFAFSGILSFSMLKTTRSISGSGLPQSSRSLAARSAASPSHGYVSPPKFGLRSSTWRRFSWYSVSMYGPVPTGQ